MWELSPKQHVVVAFEILHADFALLHIHNQFVVALCERYTTLIGIGAWRVTTKVLLL